MYICLLASERSERAQSCSCSIEISDTYVYIYIYIYIYMYVVVRQVMWSYVKLCGRTSSYVCAYSVVHTVGGV